MSAKSPPSPESILQDFESSLSRAVDGAGFGMPRCIYWDNLQANLIFAVLDLDMRSVPTPVWHAINIVDAAYTDYLLLAMDMNFAPDQGLEFADFILVCEFDRRRPEPFLTSQWRYGVVNYDKSSTPPIVRPIDWENQFWQQRGAALMKRFGPPFRCIVKRKPSTEPTNKENS